MEIALYAKSLMPGVSWRWLTASSDTFTVTLDDASTASGNLFSMLAGYGNLIVSKVSGFTELVGAFVTLANGCQIAIDQEGNYIVNATSCDAEAGAFTTSINFTVTNEDEEAELILSLSAYVFDENTRVYFEHTQCYYGDVGVFHVL